MDLNIAETLVPSSDGTRLHLRLGGDESRTPVLLLHGQASCGRVWERLMEGPLAEQARLIAPDYRGHGRSDKPRGGYRDWRIWAADIAALVEHFRLVRPILVGWSFGAAVACDYLRAGGRARAFALISGGSEADLFNAEIRGTVAPDLRALLRSRPRLGRRGFAERLVELFTHRPIESHLRGAMVDDVLAIRGAAMFGVATRRYQNDDVLAAFQGPILQIHGGQDRIRLPRAAERRADLFRDGTTEIWSDSGHAPFLDEPDRFAVRIGAFLEAWDR